MTFPISDQVSLSLTIAAGGIRAPNLSTPMLLAYHTAYVDRVRSYSSVGGGVADGFTAGTPVYRMLERAFAQNPAPDVVKVGRRANAPVHAVEFTPTAFATGNTITLTIHAPDGSSRSYSQACGGVSVNAEATALANLINADVSGYGAAGTTELLVAAAVPPIVTIDPGAGAATGQIFWYSTLRNVDFQDVTPDPGLAADITAIRAEDDDWYGGCLDSTSEAEQNILASSLDVAGKSAWIASQDSIIRDGTAGNLFEDLNGAGYARAVPTWSAHGMHEYPAVAGCAKMLTFKPGATTYANQTLSGVTRSGLNSWDLTVAQLANIRAVRGNAYIDFGGVGQIDPQAGYCSADRYVDERLTLDYIEANIPVQLANDLRAKANAGGKVPYTDEAATVARAAIRKILEPMAADGWKALVLRDPVSGTQYFTFSATAAAAQTAADKAARIFRGCEFACLITGAAQRFILTGILALEGDL